jgi:hypothetical protein
MKGLTQLLAAGALLLALPAWAAQQEPVVVTFKVIHNGRTRPAPKHIRLSLNGHSLEMPIRNGKFQVPPEFLAARKVIFETDVDGSHIRLPDISGSDFTDEEWTLHLAERANNKYYQWPGSKKAYIPSTCMLQFDSVHEEPGRIYFEEHCRDKEKPKSKDTVHSWAKENYGRSSDLVLPDPCASPTDARWTCPALRAQTRASACLGECPGEIYRIIGKPMSLRDFLKE